MSVASALESKSLRTEIPPSASRSIRMSGLARVIFAARACFGHAKSIPSNWMRSTLTVGLVSPGARIANFSIELLPVDVAVTVPSSAIVMRLRLSAWKMPESRAGTGMYAWNGSIVPPRSEIAISRSKGRGVTAPRTWSRPAVGSRSEATKAVGPAVGHATFVTSAVRSPASSVVSGEMPSSRKVNAPLRMAICSIFAEKPAWAGVAGLAGGAAASLSSRAAPSARRSICCRASRTARTASPSSSTAAIVTVRATRSAPFTLIPRRGSFRKGSVRPAWATSRPDAPRSPAATARVSPAGPDSTTSSRATPARPARGAAGRRGGRYGRTAARSKPSTSTRATALSGSRPNAALVTETVAPSSLNFRARRPGLAFGRVERSRASTVSPSIRHSLGGAVTWSRKTIVAERRDTRARVTFHGDGGADGSAAMSASRSEKSNSASPTRLALIFNDVSLRSVTRASWKSSGT